MNGLANETLYYVFDLTALPQVDRAYNVYRRTVWQIVDPCTILLFAAEGQCYVTVSSAWGELAYHLTPGTLLVIPAGHRYIRTPVEDAFCTLYYLHLTLPGRPISAPEAVTRYAREQMDLTTSGQGDHSHIAALLTDFSHQREDVAACLERIIGFMKQPTTLDRTAACLAAAELLLRVAREAGHQLRTEESVDLAAQVPAGVKLQKVMAYIRLHRKENITLDDLCGLCNFSRQHLVRVFTQEYGTTPKAYILAYRMQCAKDLFQRHPELSVKEVAEEMGFADQHYFSRLFTRITGMNPTSFKKHLASFDPTKQ